LGERCQPNPLLSLEKPALERIGARVLRFLAADRSPAGRSVFRPPLTSSAKANGVEPFAWLRDLFKQLPWYRDGEAFRQSGSGEPVTSGELDDLLPDRWLVAHPGQVWTIDDVRRQERKRKSKKPKRRRRR
jgi:hypothetical protein